MRQGDLIAERFEIEQPVGSGGMGEVYRALDRLEGQVVALKVLRGAKSVEAMRFAREAKVLAELRHPNIVRYVAHGVTPRGEMYLAMEWLEGHDLAERLRRGALGVDAGVRLAVRVGRALGLAHARGVVHRDVKPANLFLPDGDVDRVKILDFGIARFGARTATRTGTTLGTPGYMAPEQARGDRGLDARTDVFALGCVLFECLTGRPAFVGDHVMAVLAKILLDEAPRVGELVRGAPQALDALVARLLSKDPEARPSDGAVVADMLASLGSLDAARGSAASELRPSLTRGELRLLSVVMIGAASPLDVATAATLLPTGDDPGALTELRAIVEPRGGRVEVIYSGAVVATLPGAGIATDQAAHAARCALAMRALAPDAPMALTTGRAEVAGRLPVGDAIDRAARLVLARAAEPPPPPSERARGVAPRPIAIDEVTAGLLDARFDVTGDERGLCLRGDREVARAARTLLGKPTTCVGREREMGALEGIFAEVADEPVARAVLVTGPAGIGKSRLRDELSRRIRARGEPVELWVARGDPMRAGSAFLLLAQALKRAAGLLDGEPLAARQKKLRARVARHVDASAADRVTEFLGELVGTPFPDEERVQLRAARRDAMLMGDQMRRAFEDFLLAECHAQPVLLVLEDMHWGDLPTVKFVDAALRNLAGEPFMVLAFARPEVRDLFSDCWAERGVTEMRLGPLTRRASERLVRQVLGDDADAQAVARIVERAEGNAFYLEELVRAVAAGDGTALPETVLAMVQARLEGLTPEERRVLRAASVFGQTFWKDGVSMLLGGADQARDVDAWLDGLCAREILIRRGAERFPGQQEHAFRHGLVREAAYAMLTESDRALGHRLAGQWLEGAGEGDATALAEHFERGGDRAPAASWYRRAAEQALEGNDFAAALVRAERGVACALAAPLDRARTTEPAALRDTPLASIAAARDADASARREVEDERIGALRLLQAEAHRWRGELPEAEEKADAAMRALPAGSASWFGAAGEAVMAASRLGRKERVVAMVRALEAAAPAPSAAQARLVALARSAPVLLSLGEYDLAETSLRSIEAALSEGAPADPTIDAWVATARASRALLARDAGEFLVLKRAALEAFERAGNLRSACNQRVGVGYGHLELGAYAEAERALSAALAEADRMGLPGVSAAARHNLGLAIGQGGRLAEGIAVERDAARAFRAQNHRRMEGASLLYVAQLLARAGELDEAERESRAAIEALALASPLRAPALATLADVLLRAGRAAEALLAAREAKGLLDELGAVEEGESRIHLVFAEALEATGDRVGAREAIAEARRLLEARAARIVDPALRASFLERVDENARTFERARRWLDEADAGP
jgi:tetratricopeptide (TPR) repeat protein